MSAPLTINLRVIDLKEEGSGKAIAFVALNHFGTDSGVLFQCEYDNKQVGKWGVTPRQVKGNMFSYFGQFVGPLSASNQTVELNEKSAQAIGQHNVERLNALSSAVAYLLNEFFQNENRKESYVGPKVLKKTLHDQTFILNPQVNEEDRSIALFLLPLGISQREMTIAMAKLHWSFNKNVPRHFLYDDGKEGVIENVLVETGQQTEAANDSQPH